MELQFITPRDISALQEIIRQASPLYLMGARTSTVTPLASKALQTLDIVSLEAMPKTCRFIQHPKEGPCLFVEGPVSWAEAREFAYQHGHDLLAWPTEETAFVLSGIATSATGERSFGFGPVRDHVVSVSYLDHQAHIRELESGRELDFNPLLAKYEATYRPFEKMKNAPFPRLRFETDLMVGTEGQLGALVSAVIRVRPKLDSQCLFLLLPRWEEDPALHLKWHRAVQKWRGKIWSVEFLDRQSLQFAPLAIRPTSTQDLLVMEVATRHFEEVVEGLMKEVPETGEANLFEIPRGKFMELRVSVPRGVSEWVARHQVLKKGTDAQVAPENFGKLLESYRSLATDMKARGIPYVLFGHFGDAHLHFNCLPGAHQVEHCQSKLLEFYSEIKKMQGTPFAEHGVGILKQDFIRPFLQEVHFEMYNKLKEEHDPHRIFFPSGYMGLKK